MRADEHVTATAITRSGSVSESGTLADRRSDRQRKVINAVVLLSVSIDLFFAVLYTLLDARAYVVAIIVNLVNAALWAPTPLLHRFGSIWAGTWFLSVLIVSMLAFTLLLGHASGSHLFLISVASLSLIFLGTRPLLLPLAVTALAWAAFLVATRVLPAQPSLIPMSFAEAQAIFYATSALSMVAIFISSRYAIGLADAAEAELEREYQRSETLLLSILPAQIAKRLKAEERIADDHVSVSVLFADIVGFTAKARRAGPAATVAMLNRFFSYADDLAELHGCEKIKTVGDGIIAAAGLPAPRPDHATALARYALDLRAAMQNISYAGEPLRLRIGIHSGPVVAGVIGRRRFTYDIWGDTVNVAARIQQSADPGEIRVSETTRNLLAADFCCTPGTELLARGAGRLSVWSVSAEH